MGTEVFFRTIRPVSTKRDDLLSIVLYPFLHKFVIHNNSAYAVLLTDDRSAIDRFVDETGLSVVECLDEPN